MRPTGRTGKIRPPVTSSVPSPGLLDTNVFIHAYARDAATEDCRRFLLALEAGTVRAVMSPIILHELSYAFPRCLKQMSRQDVANYLLMVLGWDSVRREKGAMVDAVERWRDTMGLSFADAYLTALAAEQVRPVYSKNLRELRAQGVEVPDPLPTVA